MNTKKDKHLLSEEEARKLYPNLYLADKRRSPQLVRASKNIQKIKKLFVEALKEEKDLQEKANM